MRVHLRYWAEGSYGSHQFLVDDWAPTSDLCREVARKLRNVLVLIGPSLVVLHSPDNLLSRHAQKLLGNPWLTSPRGVNILEAIGKWRKKPTSVLFYPDMEGSQNDQVLRLTPRRPRSPRLPALALTVGQSDIKVSAVHSFDDIGSAGVFVVRRKVGGPGTTVPSLLHEVRTAVHAALKSQRTHRLGLSSAVISVSALIRNGHISRISNGLTSGLSSVR